MELEAGCRKRLGTGLLIRKPYQIVVSDITES